MVRLRLWMTEEDIDAFIALDTELMRCEVWGSVYPLISNRCRGMLSLCISDAAKHMLLNNADFIPHLIDGLLLDSEHPRKDADEAIKTAVQRDFAECVQQIALFPAGCDALKANETVMHAMLALKDKAWSEEAKICAEGALMALIPPEHHDDIIEALHIMMSCECNSVSSTLVFGPVRQLTYIDMLMSIADQWDVQEVIKKIVAELQRRKYMVWFDRKCCTRAPMIACDL